jgi:thiamine biosynthesis lipoprotein
MKDTRLIMGMPITIEIVAASDDAKAREAVEKAFAYFTHIDETFSTYKDASEISAINAGRLARDEWSPEMELVFTLSEETKRASGGFFDIKRPDGNYDPSGLVKGWAIANAAQLLIKEGFRHFFVEAGGDIQVRGVNGDGDPWMIGVKNPWSEGENVQAIRASRNEGVATSGTYIRGTHIYNPRNGKPADAIMSLTVIGPNIYEADRFATAAFAMGRDGIRFIESIPGLEGYMIDNDKIATKTSNWDNFQAPDNEITNNSSL